MAALSVKGSEQTHPCREIDLYIMTQKGMNTYKYWVFREESLKSNVLVKLYLPRCDCVYRVEQG